MKRHPEHHKERWYPWKQQIDSLTVEISKLSPIYYKFNDNYQQLIKATTVKIVHLFLEGLNFRDFIEFLNTLENILKHLITKQDTFV